MANRLSFDPLSPYRKRSFLPDQIDLGNWNEIEPLFHQLEASIATCPSATAAEQWLLHASELQAALDEESSRRYIAMTCHTDDEEAEKAYLQFVEEIEPKTKPRQFELARQFLNSAVQTQLQSDRYFVLIRELKSEVELFRKENVPLETEESKLGQQYQKWSGSLTVQFRGEEKTLTQMGPYLEEPDRPLREEVWRLVSDRRLQEKDRIDDLFDKQLSLRRQIASNAGFDNYRDYAFRHMGRFDYTPADCEAFHDAVEAEVVPLLKELHAERRSKLNLESLRPWDLSVDPQNRPPLKPFGKIPELIEHSQSIFDQVDEELSGQFKLMRDRKLLDLENRKGKAPGGYQCDLSEARVPFIFMNAVGVQRDVETLLHEAGHAFHALATREEDIHEYRHAPIEFCEVASMSMELLGAPHLDQFYSEADARRAREQHLQGIVNVFPWIATIDAFQHWIYTHPNHTREERGGAWLKLVNRFGGDVDWSGLEEARRHLWHRQLHIFLHPFYYIEYGIAQLGALQVWKNSKENTATALRQYKEALALGGSRPLPELFEKAGCRFQFDRSTFKPLIAMVRQELEQLAED